LEIAGLKVARDQLRNAIALVYSFAVMATIIPGFHLVPHLLLLPYFLMVPGYFIARLLRSTGSLLETLFYSIIWSITLFLSAYSVETILPSSQLLPIEIVVPGLTILLLAFDSLRRSPGGARS
jgi:hypothetical protein